MARCARVDVGGQIYHVINRAVGRLQVFNTPGDYLLFLKLLRDAQELTGIQVFAYCLMPNHWHLLLCTKNDGELSLFMHALTNSHTRIVHALTKTVGTGPLYQGRYKSFMVQGDAHFLAVHKYIERNAVRVNLSVVAEGWRWGSAWLRVHGTVSQKKLLADPPVVLPIEYVAWVNTSEKEEDVQGIRISVNKGTPYGGIMWVEQMVDKYKLEATVRGKGRPSQQK